MRSNIGNTFLLAVLFFIFTTAIGVFVAPVTHSIISVSLSPFEAASLRFFIFAACFKIANSELRKQDEIDQIFEMPRHFGKSDHKATHKKHIKFV